MHSVTLNRLQSFEDQAKQQGNPQLYLQLLSPLHALWHDPARRRRVGFLLFHWHVIEHFTALGLEAAMHVHPDTVADFSAGGRFAEADWNASMGGVADSTSLQELVDYSAAIEGWHNEAHMVIGEVTGLDMMNPRANVFFTEFWNLHFFINARFEEQMASYAKSTHPELKDSAAIVSHIEEQHPSVIARV
jgi:hypothetical protein